jgi:hypothetical protein
MTCFRIMLSIIAILANDLEIYILIFTATVEADFITWHFSRLLCGG